MSTTKIRLTHTANFCIVKLVTDGAYIFRQLGKRIHSPNKHPSQKLINKW